MQCLEFLIDSKQRQTPY